MPLALLHVSYSRPEAEVLKSRLAADGITAFLFDTGVTGSMPHMSVAFGGIRIMVPDEALDQARIILEDRGDSDLETETEAFRQNKSQGFAGLLLSFLIAWFPVWNRSRKFKTEEKNQNPKS